MRKICANCKQINSKLGVLCASVKRFAAICRLFALTFQFACSSQTALVCARRLIEGRKATRRGLRAAPISNAPKATRKFNQINSIQIHLSLFAGAFCVRAFVCLFVARKFVLRPDKRASNKTNRIELNRIGKRFASFVCAQIF